MLFSLSTRIWNAFRFIMHRLHKRNKFRIHYGALTHDPSRRHFPTRESLVDAVYRDQVERLTAGARELLTSHPPAEALRRWMDLFADWVATKRGMLQTLLTMIDAGSIPHAATHDTLIATIATILEAGIAAGEIRPDASADDVAASLLGILTVAGASDQKAQAGRLLDLLMDGLRPRP
jgi:AcrR family transcriptional regulator